VLAAVPALCYADDMGALTTFYRSTLGKKVCMAVTGLVMIGFVIGHMAGNLKIFAGFEGGTAKLDLYAEHLRAIGEEMFGRSGLLWGARLGLIAAVVLHIWSAIQLKRISAAARPVGYAKYTPRGSTFASRTMYWGGLFLALYLVFHILHFTTGTVHFAGFEEGKVYQNVVNAFRSPFMTALYVVAMVFLGLHLYHGTWSAMQTLGLDNPDRNQAFRHLARAVSLVVAVGFALVPIAVFVGLVPQPPAAQTAQNSR
jgi:succinate dehydrogenase / fumarate reductase, cytochrome b subunit